MTPFTHSLVHSTNIYQVPSSVIKTQPLPERLSLHQERDTNKNNTLLWGHPYGRSSVEPDSQSGGSRCQAERPYSAVLSLRQVAAQSPAGRRVMAEVEALLQTQCHQLPAPPEDWGEPWSPRTVKVSQGRWRYPTWVCHPCVSATISF